jgi:hypothetical protein
MHLLPISASICLFATGATLARAADDPPPTTTATTTTTTTVVPDGAYGWELARPEPRRQSQPSTAPPAPAPAVTTITPRPATTVSRPLRARHAKARHVRRPRAARTVRVVKPQRTGAVLAANTTAEQSMYASALILAALGLAIACFTVGATPARRVRWRTGSAFVAYHSTQATIAGGVALLLAVALLVLTGGR